jgi:hypothetical protein
MSGGRAGKCVVYIDNVQIERAQPLNLEELPNHFFKPTRTVASPETFTEEQPFCDSISIQTSPCVLQEATKYGNDLD